MRPSRIPICLMRAFVSLMVAGLFANAQTVNTRFDASAEWRPSDSTLQKAHDSCVNLEDPNLGTCFAGQMKQAGASRDAIKFFNRTGGQAFLEKFSPLDGPDLAFVFYPYRANHNEGCLLINGAGKWIDVDDLAKLPVTEMQKDPGYATVAKAHPELNLFGGDRGNRKSVRPMELTGDRRRISVAYPILDGCHACARVARAWFAFDFDPEGKFLGTYFQRVAARRSSR